MTAALTPAGTYDTPIGRSTLGDAPTWCRIVVFIGIVAYAVTLVIAVVRGSFFLLGACVQVPIWALVTIPIARKLARSEHDAGVYGFVMAAFAAKMLGVLVRQAVAYGLYNGVLDANTYDKAGRQLAPFYRHFDFSPNVGKLTGTGFLKAVTGFVYAFMGTSELGAFVFFSFLSFLGLVMLWRAFRRAVPDGDGRRYGLFVLFLPSLLYWPSALGKEGFGIFCVGLASYGVALLLTRQFLPGLLLLAGGIVGLMYLRPHVALVVFGGLVFAALLAKPQSASPSAPIVRVIVFGTLFVVGLVLVSQAKSFLGVNSLDQSTVNKKLSDTTYQTGASTDAGSRFTPVTIHSPIDVPWATITVLFRPLPWEAHSGQELATTAENCLILLIAVKSWPRLRSIPREAREHPYVAYCIGFTAMFVFAFSSFSNFGILARQRTQTIPLVLVLLCLPEHVPKWKREQTPSGTRVIDRVEAAAPASAWSDNPYAPFVPAASDHEARNGDAAPNGDGLGGPYGMPEPAFDRGDPYTPFGNGAHDDPYARFRDDRR